MKLKSCGDDLILFNQRSFSTILVSQAVQLRSFWQSANMVYASIFLVIGMIFTGIMASPVDRKDPYAQDMKQRELIGIHCLKENELDRRVVDRTMLTLEFPVENQKYKDFLACSYKLQGFQTQDGKMQFENINHFLSRFYSTADLKKLDVCKSNSGKNDGERAFNAVVCIMDQLKTIEVKSDNEI